MGNPNLCSPNRASHLATIQRITAYSTEIAIFLADYSLRLSRSEPANRITLDRSIAENQPLALLSTEHYLEHLNQTRRLLLNFFQVACREMRLLLDRDLDTLSITEVRFLQAELGHSA
jgi:hypothetical protein